MCIRDRSCTLYFYKRSLTDVTDRPLLLTVPLQRKIAKRSLRNVLLYLRKVKKELQKLPEMKPDIKKPAGCVSTLKYNVWFLVLIKYKQTHGINDVI